jgi:hypothetical protein
MRILAEATVPLPHHRTELLRCSRKASGVAPLRRFASRRRADNEAVQAGLTLHWSHGPVEGQSDRSPDLGLSTSYKRAGQGAQPAPRSVVNFGTAYLALQPVRQHESIGCRPDKGLAVPEIRMLADLPRIARGHTRPHTFCDVVKTIEVPEVRRVAIRGKIAHETQAVAVREFFNMQMVSRGFFGNGVGVSSEYV